MTAKLRKKIHKEVLSGTNDRPRASVFRSNKAMNIQLIDDEKGATLLSASTSEIKDAMKPVEKSRELGKLVATKAKEKKIAAVVFDRNNYRYHGRVKAVAEGMREAGIKL
jgi:large subunit ribosomal protein L18